MTWWTKGVMTVWSRSFLHYDVAGGIAWRSKIRLRFACRSFANQSIRRTTGAGGRHQAVLFSPEFRNWIISSRITNFCTFPVTVNGISSTK